MKRITFINYLLLFSSFCAKYLHSIPTIYVFGDSHASFCFRERETIVENDFLTYFHEPSHTQYPIHITSFIGVTMHRVGRDSLSFLNIKQRGVKNGDVVVYVFGEVDVRCHIGKQRDQTKKLYQKLLIHSQVTIL